MLCAVIVSDSYVRLQPCTNQNMHGYQHIRCRAIAVLCKLAHNQGMACTFGTHFEDKVERYEVYMLPPAKLYHEATQQAGVIAA